MPDMSNRESKLSAFTALALAGQLGFAVAVPIVGGVLIGNYLDRWLGAGGVILVFAILFGVACGVYSGFSLLMKEVGGRVAGFLREDEEDERANGHEPGPCKEGPSPSASSIAPSPPGNPKPFSTLVAGLSLLLTIGAGGVAVPFDTSVAKGIIMGGIVSTLGFALMARDASAIREIAREGQVANPGRDRVKSGFRKLPTLRMLCYLGVLVGAYRLDAERCAGTVTPGELRVFFGAAGGLFAVRIIVTLVGMTGRDLKSGA